MEQVEKRKKTVTVLFDPQIFLLQKHGGISRYFSEIIKAFGENPSLGILPVMETQYVLSSHALEALSAHRLRPLRSQVISLMHLIRLSLTRDSMTNNVDLVHQTFYLPGFLRRYKKIPRVVTLHDMIPENTQKRFAIWNPHFIKRKYIFAANLVLSVSNASTKDMRARYGHSESVTTTHLGVGPEFMPSLPRPTSNPNPYFLFVGQRQGYKDFLIALRAFSSTAKIHKSLEFKLVGGGKLSLTERRLVRKFDLTNRVQQLQVADEALPNFYSNAVALIYPSRYEGFGLPLVEAMASGAPILASDTPVNREICGMAAEYFEPGSQEQLFSLMGSLATEPSAFSDKIKLGLARALEFTWYKCAEKTALAYRSLVEIESKKG